MGSVWGVYGVCMGCVRGVYGVCMGCVWGVYGAGRTEAEGGGAGGIGRREGG